MKYFIVYAHPEPTSFTGYLKDQAVAMLTAAGHEVVVSDLYAMKWKAVGDTEDFPQRDASKPLNYEKASREAFTNGTQSSDIAEEQRKLLWADVVVFQFPLWWYSMPAILKGWVDRVFANGFAYGIGVHGGGRWGDRFGEGTLLGRRAVVAMMVGGRMAHYGPRGVNGPIDDLLWPIQHGILFYPGLAVVPPIVFYELGHASTESIADLTKTYLDRLLNIATDVPIPFRTQNGGDYDDVQVLRVEHDSGTTGHALHQRAPVFISNTYLGTPGDYTPLHIAPTNRKEE